MSYKKTRYPDDSLIDDIYNKLHRMGRYASRQELLDEIRDLNLELEREKKVLGTYRSRYEEKVAQSSDLTKNLSTARDYQENLEKEKQELESQFQNLKLESEKQKGDIDVLKKELDNKDVEFLVERRRALAAYAPREYLNSSDYPYSYRYNYLRPWLYRNHRDIYDKYYPYYPYDKYDKYSYDKYDLGYYRRHLDSDRYSSYYPYYYRYGYPYESSTARRLALESRMDSIRGMVDDLRVNNDKMIEPEAAAEEAAAASEDGDAKKARKPSESNDE